MPKTATSDSMYTAALAMVPPRVARGTLCSGLRTLDAATAATSTPRKLNRQIAAAPPRAELVVSPLVFHGVKLALEMKNRPTVAMKISGTNLNTVVTTWKALRLRTPVRLTAAGIQRPARTMRIDQVVLPPLLTKCST